MAVVRIFQFIVLVTLIWGCSNSNDESTKSIGDENDPIDFRLNNLTTPSGVLTPAFTQENSNYSLQTSSTKISFIPEGISETTVTINGTATLINEPSIFFDLSEGPNQFDIIVSGSEAVERKTYTVIVQLTSQAPDEPPIITNSGPVPELYEGIEVGRVTDFIDNSGTETTVDQLVEMYLSMDVGSTDFCKGYTSAHVPSTTWGFNVNDGRVKNNAILGPTLKLIKGKNYRIHITNNLHDGDSDNPGLGVKSTVHWHGLSLLGEKDGGPHQMINSTYDPTAVDHSGNINSTTWTVDIPMVNDSATFWYHPHAEGITAQHVYNGLAGMMIIKNPSQNPAIPNTYGVDDFPIIIQDKGLGDISLRSNNVSETMTDSDDCLLDRDGNVGSIVNAFKGAAQVVNGEYKSHFTMPPQIVRLRILNGADARSYNLGIVDSNGNSVPFYQIGTDGGLLNTVDEISRLLMYNGERNEILLNLSNANKGETYKVMSFGSELDLITLGLDDRNVDITGDQDNLDTQDYDIFEFTIGDTISNNAVINIPTSIRPENPIVRLDPINADSYSLSNPRDFILKNANAIEYDNSGRSEKMEMDVINLSPQYGATEVWRVTAESGLRLSHPFHVHDGSFQVLKRVMKEADLSEGGEIALTPAERGWKDVVQIREDEYLYIIKEFSFYSYAGSPFMLHCHILPHEDEGMMGQWTVIE